MATASIRIDQPLHPTTPVGQPGRARDDLQLALPVVMRNADDTDVTRWVWAIVDRPLGSTSTLSSTTSAQATFTPDVAGSYLIRLSVADALAGEVDLKVAAVRTSLGVRYPAAGETAAAVNWPGNNDLGWAKDAEQVLRGLARPQLLDAAQLESIPAATASTVVGIGGLGLPTSLAELVDEGFVDLDPPAVGGPPTITSWAFASFTGGGKTVDALVADIDATATATGDKWALVIGVAGIGDVLVLQISIT